MTLADKIIKLLENSIIFTSEQKQGWLKLLPQMIPSELKELHSILVDEVKELKSEGMNLIEDPKLEAELISTSDDSASHGASIADLKAAAAPVKNSAFAKELDREVHTKELRKPTPEELGQKTEAQAPKPAPAPLRPAPVATRPTVQTSTAPKPPVAPKSINLAPMPESLRVPQAPRRVGEVPRPTGGLQNLLQIRTVDDLKRIGISHIRQGELKAQIDLIRAKIISIAQADRILPFYTVSAFEQSPLYKAYLEIGTAMIADPDRDRAQAFERASQKGTEKLTMREFEAIADLRKEIEQL